MNRLIFLFFALLFAMNSSLAADVQTAGPPVIKIPVFYATQRKKICDEKDPAGKELGEFKTGCGNAWLPISETWKNPSTKRLITNLIAIGCEIDNSRATVVPFIEARGYVAEPSPEKVLKIDENCGHFWKKLRSYAKSSVGKEVYVYIHGFASSGNNAVYSSGILSAHVEAPVIAYTWPSVGKLGLIQGNPELTLSLFKLDKEMIGDDRVLKHLQEFLSDLRSKLDSDVKINIVAHSLGNRLLCRYLNSGQHLKLSSLYFLAADVDKKDFLKTAEYLKEQCSEVVVYHNPKDNVLRLSRASQLLDLDLTEKLGASGFPLPSIRFVDYELIAQPRDLQHYIPFEHFGSICRSGKPAEVAGASKLFIFNRTRIETAEK
ncbi:MAG: alpha/beta hydrolase [Cyanobacteria bacterium TGS_CYA1]|nr:alpha/beta hydrolase [Cyanobacteria bacterium TGS_CYA1]